jgi:hypothetical protein
MISLSLFANLFMNFTYYGHASRHRCSLQGGVTKGFQQCAQCARELFALGRVQGLEHVCRVREIEAEEPIHDSASMRQVWRCQRRRRRPDPWCQLEGTTIMTSVPICSPY